MDSVKADDIPKQSINQENNNFNKKSSTTKTIEETPSNSITLSSSSSFQLSSKQLAGGFLEILEPPAEKAPLHLKELTCKQGKIHTEKFKLNNAGFEELQIMMNNVKVYRGKLLKIKKQMQSIYHRTQSLKKRPHFKESYKQKELQRKLLKQQQEKALIGKGQSS